ITLSPWALLLHSVTLFLTSATKCFPGASASGKGDRMPSATEVALCAGHLDREIALVRPELVIGSGSSFLRRNQGMSPSPFCFILPSVATF
ncbi:MAG: uracil-DNA glycosylase family protein, partial [Thermomicrobiales bacterium]